MSSFLRGLWESKPVFQICFTLSVRGVPCVSVKLLLSMALTLHLKVSRSWQEGKVGEERGAKYFRVKKPPAQGELFNTSVIPRLLPGGRFGQPDGQVLEGKWASHRATASWWGCVAQRKNIWKINEQNLVKIALGPSYLLLTVNYRKKTGMSKKKAWENWNVEVFGTSWAGEVSRRNNMSERVITKGQSVKSVLGVERSP